MKQKLTLLLIALLTTMGAWAETVTVTSGSALWSTTGTLGYNGSENWAVSWTSSDEKIKITCPANGHIYKNSSQMGTNTFTIWTPGSEMITGFSMTFTSNAGANCTVTSGLTSAKSTGTSDTKTITVSGLFVHFVKITVSGQYANVSEFSINYSSMPALSGTGYYLIEGKYPANSYLYGSPSEPTKLMKNKNGEADVSALYFNADYVWKVDEYDSYRSLYNVGRARYVSNFTTANSTSASQNGSVVNLLDAEEFSDAEIFTLTDNTETAGLTGSKAFKACSKENNCYLDNYTNSNNYVGFHSAAHQGDPFLLIRVYKVTFKAADNEGNEIDGQVPVNGNLTNAIYVPASTTLTSVGGSKYFISGVEKTESEVITAVSGVTDDNLVVYVTPTPSTITVNFKQGEETIATKEISAKIGYEYNIVTTLGFQSRYMSTDPATVTGTSSDQNIDVETTFTLPFTVCSNPETDEEMSHVYYFKMDGKYAKGNQLTASLDREDKDYFWTFGGDYINGFTIYNKGQESYMSNGDTDNSVAVFDGTTSKYVLFSHTDTGFYLKVQGTDKNYLNNRSSYLSTWNSYDIAYYMQWPETNESYFTGSFITIEDVESDLSDLYTYVNGNYGSELGKYHVSTYTSSDVSTAISTAETAYSGGDVYEAGAAAQTLSSIKEDMSINIPTKPIFFRIRSSQGDKGYMTAAVADGRATFTSATDKTTIYLWASDSKLVAYGNGLAYNMMYVPKANVADAVSYNIIPAVSGNIGQYSITCQNDKSETIYLYSTGSGNADRNTASDNFKQQNSFTLEAVDELPITMHEVGGAYYGTINLPVAVTIPSGLKAYKASVAGDVLNLSKVVENGVLAANQPVILYSVGSVASLTISNDAGEEAAGNDLQGTIAAETVEARSTYVLSQNPDNNIVGFYKYNDTTMPGFKAYLPATATSSVKGFTFSFEDVEDAIRAIESENSNLEIYDIAGRRVQKAQKGLYIVNGKKVMFK